MPTVVASYQSVPNYLASLATDSAGNVYAIQPLVGGGRVAASRLLKISPQGVSSVVRTGLGGPAQAARGGVAVDQQDNVYVSYSTTLRSCGFADCDGPGSVLKISPSGTVTTLMTESQGVIPNRIAVDGAGSVYVSADEPGNVVGTTNLVKLSPTGQILYRYGLTVFGPGPRFMELAIVPPGNLIYAGNSVNLLGVTNFAGPGSPAPGSLAFESLAGLLGEVGGLAVDAAGNLYVADYANHVIRKITPSRVSSIVVGTLGQERIELGALPGSIARPTGVAVNREGTLLYISSGNALLRVKLP